VEDVTGQQYSYVEYEEDEHQEARPSTMTMNIRVKYIVQISPRKHKEETLTLPRIPKGVTILLRILECVDKSMYPYHDIKDRDKFHVFAP
jgi:hypothetical protein